MAVTVGGLNRRINDLQGELRTIKSDYERELSQTQAYYSKKLTELQRKKDEELRRLQVQCNENSRALVKNAIDNIKRETDAQINAQKRLFEDYKRRCETVIAEMKRAEAETRQLLDNYLEKEKRSEAAKKQVAKNYLEAARTVEDEMLGLPLRFFSENTEFETIQAHMNSAEEEIKNSNFEAAMSMASNCRSRMMQLYYRFNSNANKWKEYFEEWSALVINAHMLLDSALNTPVQTQLANCPLDEFDWDFWTQGDFGSLNTELSNSKEIIDKVQNIGVIAYLKTPDAITLDELRDKHHEASKYYSDVETVVSKGAAEVQLSDEREFIAGKIIDRMMAANYFLVDKDSMGYSSPDSMVASKEWYRKFCDRSTVGSGPISDYVQETQNPLAYYGFSMSYAGGDKLLVRIVPDRLDGVAVRNVCIIETILNGAPNMAVYSDLMKQNFQRIDEVVSDPDLHTQMEPMPNGIINNRLEKKTKEYQSGRERTRKVII